MLAPAPTSFIGHEKETAEIARLLTGAGRLLTLTGPAGVGKTRLALEAAAGMGGQFAHGVMCVSLAPLRDPSLVVAALAAALGVPERQGRSRLDSLKEALRDRSQLLVLDNFEQVLPAAPVLVELVIACPGLRLLVTSRAALRVSGEQEFVVSPLRLPGPGAAMHNPAELGRVEAVQLFVDRARAVRSDFALSEQTAGAVADICERLDGLPLAIELAAAWARVLEPPELRARLQHRLPLLMAGARDLPPRQQTLRAAIGWSYELLDADERRLFRQLAVFAGGCTLEAAEAVCGAESTLLVLARLVEQSLLRHEPTGDEPRFGMLETTREYALEQLETNGEADVLRRRHASYYLRLAEIARPELSGPSQAEWLERLEREHANFRAALQAALDRGDVDTALRLAAALNGFWEARGHLAEGRRWLDAALARGESQPPASRAAALHGAAVLALRQGDHSSAAGLLQEALALWRGLGDQAGTAASLNTLANAVMNLGDYGRARALFQESLSIQRELNDRRGVATALHNLGTLAATEGDHQAARPLLEEGLALRREMGDLTGIALALDNLGVVLRVLGDYAQADALLEEGLELRRHLGHKWGISSSLANLAQSALDQGDAARAATLTRESLRLAWEIGDHVWIPNCLEEIAGALVQEEQVLEAARLLGAAEALRERVGCQPAPYEIPRLEGFTAGVRARLEPAALATQWTAGRAMSLEQAVQAALGTDRLPPANVEPSAPSTPSTSCTPQANVAALTQREREVAALVARGLSNRQISEALVIAEATATVHVKHILAKLEFASRAQVAAWAVSCGLLAVTPMN